MCVCIWNEDARCYSMLPQYTLSNILNKTSIRRFHSLGHIQTHTNCFGIEMSAKWNRHFATNKLNYGRTYPHMPLMYLQQVLRRYANDKRIVTNGNKTAFAFDILNCIVYATYVNTRTFHVLP